MAPHPFDPTVSIVVDPGDIIGHSRRDGRTCLASLQAKNAESVDLHFVFISDDSSFQTAGMPDFIDATSYDTVDAQGNVLAAGRMVDRMVVGGSPPDMPVLWCTVNITPFPGRTAHRFRVRNQSLGIDFTGGVAVVPPSREP